MPRRRSVVEMVGEGLREAGVLVTVFLPLEALYESGISVWTVIERMAVCGVGAFVAGVAIERRRAMEDDDDRGAVD